MYSHSCSVQIVISYNYVARTQWSTNVKFDQLFEILIGHSKRLLVTIQH